MLVCKEFSHKRYYGDLYNMGCTVDVLLVQSYEFIVIPITQKFLKLLIASLCLLLTLTGVAFGKTIPIPQSASVEQINTLIANADDYSILEFSKGTFLLKGQLIIARDHITLQGSKSGKTILQFKFPDGVGDDFIQISGSGKSIIDRLGADAHMGAKRFRSKFINDLKPGDHVYLARSNTLAYFKKNKWFNLKPETAISRVFRETINLVTKVNDKSVTLKSPLPFEFTSTQSTWQKINMRKGVRLNNLTITGLLGKPDALDFENNYLEFHSKAAIRAFQTSGLHLEKLTIKDVPSKAIAIDRSYGAQLDDIKISGSHNKGIAGNGYGVELREVFNSDLTRMIITDVRHAALFSSWHAEVGNLVHIEYTNRDVNFHGTPDHSNTILIDEMVLEYDETARSGRPRHAWRALSFGGTNHARTNFIANNDITFAKAKGGWRRDILPASPVGSILDGRKGDDFLIGNKGVDYFTGGQGRDWFVPGGNADVITDFKTGKKGDVLLLDGKPKITNLEEGVLVAVGQSTTLLLGIKSDDLHPKNIVLCNRVCVEKRIEAFENH